jgi:glutamine amidotransferase
MIAIVDYDVGNLQSVVNMLAKLGVSATCTNDAGVIREADAIILPGNGSFGHCMRNLRQTGLIPVLERRVADGVSLLGICVGAQLLGNGSEEGGGGGLGWLDMDVRRFAPSAQLRVPQMGWNYVLAKKKSQLTDGFDPTYRFYFVHSYFMQPKHTEDVLLSTEYGNTFVSGVEHGNIFGVQFHPEKSHRFGKKLLHNFAKVSSCIDQE